MVEKIILALTFIVIASVTIYEMVTNGYSNKQMFYLGSAVVLTGYLWIRNVRRERNS